MLFLFLYTARRALRKLLRTVFSPVGLWILLPNFGTVHFPSFFTLSSLVLRVKIKADQRLRPFNFLSAQRAQCKLLSDFLDSTSFLFFVLFLGSLPLVYRLLHTIHTPRYLLVVGRRWGSNRICTQNSHQLPSSSRCDKCMSKGCTIILPAIGFDDTDFQYTFWYSRLYRSCEWR